MSDNIEIAGPIAFMSGSQSAVFFSQSNPSAGTFQKQSGTAVPVRQLQDILGVAYWGEDNRFPQNIENQLAYCGVAKSALDWKAKALWGSGIVPGKIIDYDEKTGAEIFQPLKRDQYKPVYAFIEQRSMYRFWLEYLQDWTWFFNCFPEVILSKDCNTITGLVHHESCDSRFKQMDINNGVISTVFLSKLWGAAKDQYAKFDPKKSIRGLIDNPFVITKVDNLFVKTLGCIDMYDPVNSLKKIAEQQKKKAAKELRSAILPVNYPSVNKTYYQVPYWDGARLSGWIEIACKNPAVLKQLLNKAYRIRYHIEVPESYFERKYGFEKWHLKDETEQLKARKDLLKDMDKFLSGDDKAFNSFISFFDVAPHDKTEYGRIKIAPVEDKSTIDKDLILTSAADQQILVSMQVHPTLFGAATLGTGTQRSGGSDIREAWLTYTANLNLERNVMLEPLYLVRDYNRIVGGMAEWGEDIVFRVRDTVLTTLDQGTGTVKKLS